MEKSSFFNAVLDTNGTPDRSYLAEDFAQFFSTFIGNGVFPNPSTQCQVVAIDNNMTIRIKSGFAWINGYMYQNTDDYILTLDVADGVLNRIDRVVLRLDFLERKIKAAVKKGDYASSAVPKTLQRDADAYEIALADVYVNKGIISITQANITDLRLNKDICGIVHGTVDQVDTTAIFNQFQSWYSQKQDEYNTYIEQWTQKKKQDFDNWYTTNTMAFMEQFSRWYETNTTTWNNDFETWFSTIKGQLDGDIAAKLSADVVALKEGKLDKVTGKGLSTNDYSNAEKQEVAKIPDIESQLGESINYQEQEDFVDSLSKQQYVKEMFFNVYDKNAISFGVGYNIENNKGINYYLTPQSNDNYSILQGGRIGDISSIMSTFAYKKYDSKNGTFNELYLPNGFTTNVGDKLFFTFTDAEEVSFNHYKDNRGGRWKATLTGDTANSVYVSCYLNGSQTTQAVLFTNLNKAQVYNLVLEFVGDDPLNIPSGGVGTSRGWYCLSTDNNVTNKDTLFLRRRLQSVVNYIEPLKSGSNKEFAFYLRRKGQTYSPQFFPWHSNIISTEKVKDFEVVIDGVKYDKTSLEDGRTYNNISKVELIQYIYCKLPDDVNRLGYLISKHTFLKNGVVEINCSFKALENLEIIDGYVGMFPVLSQFCKKLKTSYMVDYETIKTAGYTNLNEKDNVLSYIWGNGERSDVAIAMTWINPLSSLRKGKIGRRYPLFWIEHRDNTMQKLYPHIFKNGEMIQNEVLKFGCKFILANIDNLNELYFM